MKTVVEALISDITSLAEKVQRVDGMLPAGISARDTLGDLYNHLKDAEGYLREDLDEVPEV